MALIIAKKLYMIGDDNMSTILERPKINYDLLKLTDHATKRVKERFNRIDQLDAEIWVKSILKEAEYVGITKDKYKQRNHAFKHSNILIGVSLDCLWVKTVYKADKQNGVVYEDEESKHSSMSVEDILIKYDKQLKISVQERTKRLYQREQRRHERVENRMIKEIEILKFKNSLSVAELELKRFRCKSEGKRVMYTDMINEIQSDMLNRQNALQVLQDQKHKIIKTLVSFGE